MNEKRKNSCLVLYEDHSLLVYNKPAGLVVNRAKTVKQPTLQDILANYLKVKSGGIGDRAGIVHRLDKETSGIILVAKTPQAFVELQKQFKERKVNKKYLALVHGQLQPKKGIIKAPISRSPFDRKKFGVFLGGRGAETAYQVIKKYRHPELGNFSLLALIPKTGRTHQIRVHLKHLGHPVVGDQFYAGRKTARGDRHWCSRQFLHASQIVLTHPQSGQKVKFVSPLPKDLKKALKVFK